MEQKISKSVLVIVHVFVIQDMILKFTLKYS